MEVGRKARYRPAEGRSAGHPPRETPPRGAVSPLSFLAITVASIFVVEVLVMGLLALLPPLSAAATALVDAALLSALILPALYFFSYRPMLLDLARHVQAGEEHARLAAVVEQMPDGVFICSTHGTIEYVNPAFEKITGHARDDALGQNPDVLQSGEQNSDYFEKLRDSLGRGEVWTGQSVGKRKDGTLYDQDATISPIRNASSEIIGFVSIQRDITGAIAIADQLRQAQKMEAVGQLAGGVAHDFNNLLVAILGYTDLVLKEIAPSDPRHADLLQVRAAGERAATLTHQLLAFSRQQMMRFIDFDLNEAIAEVVDMLQRIIGETIDLDIIPGHRTGTIHGDPAQIEQVLVNLCLNARDAMPDGGKITIETENVLIDSAYRETHPWAVEGRYDLLSVTDNGCGMDNETMNRVFEPFFTTKEPGRGTGLGLAMVYGIVKQHEGMIHVYSEPGQGTTFKIYLQNVGRPAAKIGPKIIGPAPTGTETILLAEDDQLVLDLAARILEEAGYTVLTANDGEEALRVFEAHGGEIDLVLLDVVMPKLGGRAVRDSIHAQRSDARVLFTSGYSANAIHTDFVLDECVELLPKPYDENSLLRRVRQVLDSGGASPGTRNSAP